MSHKKVTKIKASSNQDSYTSGSFITLFAPSMGLALFHCCSRTHYLHERLPAKKDKCGLEGKINMFTLRQHFRRISTSLVEFWGLLLLLRRGFFGSFHSRGKVLVLKVSAPLTFQEAKASFIQGKCYTFCIVYSMWPDLETLCKGTDF